MLRYLLPNPASSPPRCVKDNCSAFHSSCTPPPLHCYFERKSTIWIVGTVHIQGHQCFVFFLWCTDLSGIDRRRAGDLWVVGRTALPHFSPVNNLPRSCSGKKRKKESALESLYVLHFVMFLFLCPTRVSLCIKHSGCHEWEVNLWPWFSQQRKFPALPGNGNLWFFIVLSLSFQCNWSLQCISITSLLLHKTDAVGNELLSSTLQSYLIFWNVVSTFYFLLYLQHNYITCMWAFMYCAPN